MAFYWQLFDPTGESNVYQLLPVVLVKYLYHTYFSCKISYFFEINPETRSLVLCNSFLTIGITICVFCNTVHPVTGSGQAWVGISDLIFFFFNVILWISL